METWITLEQWDELHYPQNRHTISTLRKWAKNKIHPKPERHGRPLMVRPDAKYIPTGTEPAQHEETDPEILKIVFGAKKNGKTQSKRPRNMA